MSVLVVETPEGGGLYSPQTSNRTILGLRHVKGPNIFPIKSPDTSGTARVSYIYPWGLAFLLVYAFH